MKYILPRSLKVHSFFCQKVNNFVNFNSCKNCKFQNNKKDCWTQNLLKDLQVDCDVNNERKTEKYAVCPECKSRDVIGTAFNGYMCVECGGHFTLLNDEMRKILGNEFEEIDLEEFNSKISKYE